jgi:6-phosphogluconolactonase
MRESRRIDGAEVRVFETKGELAHAAAARVLRIANRSVEHRESFKVALSGGHTPLPVYEALSRQPYSWEMPWRKTQFFWGDERLVPPDDPGSNYKQAWDHMLEPLGIDAAQIHRIKGELPSEEAVEEYRRELLVHADSGLAWPRFDLVLLGLGANGHTASLFPGAIHKEEHTSPVMAALADDPDRPARRVTLTPMAINSALNILFLVSGEEKSRAVGAVLQGERDPLQWPAQRIEPTRGELLWYIDSAASKDLAL